MSQWLDPTGKSSYGIGVCDRCHQKFSITDLYPDPNSPGLRVCLADMDVFDPYRLPARQTENIALQFTRPDSPLDGHEGESTAYVIEANGSLFVLGTELGEALEITGVVV